MRAHTFFAGLLLVLSSLALPASAQTFLSQQSLSGGPRVVLVNPVNNKVYIARHANGTVHVINVATGAALDVDVVSHGLPQSLALDPATGTVVVGTDQGVAFIDGNTDALVSGQGGGTTLFLTQAGSVGNIAINPNPSNHMALLSDQGNAIVWFADNVANSESNATGVLQCPGPLAVNPVTSTTYVADTCGAAVTWFESSGAPGGTINLVTTTDPEAPMPVNPVAIAVNPVTNQVYVALDGNSGIAVIDGTSKTVTATIAAGAQPSAIAVNPATNKIYVANSGSGSLAVINGGNNSFTLLDLGGPVRPVAITVDNVRNRIYVANKDGGYVAVIDGDGDTVVKNVATGGAPNSVAVNPLTSRVYVVDETNETFTIIDGREFSGTGGAVFLTGTTQMVVDPLRARVFLVNGNHVGVGSTGDDSLDANIDMGVAVNQIAVDSISGTLFVALADGTVKMIGTGNTILTNPDTSQRIITLGGTPTAMAANPATQKVYISTTAAQLQVIDAVSMTLGNPVGLANSPADIAIDAAHNHVYIADNESPGFNADLFVGESSAHAMNGSTNSATTRVVANPATGRVYFMHADAIDEFNGLVTFPPPFIHAYTPAHPPTDIAVNSITNLVYYTDQSSSLHVIDPVSQSDSTIAIGDAGNHVAVDELSNRIYVSTPTTVLVVDGETGTVVASICATIVSAVCTVSSPGRAAIDPTIGEAWVPVPLASDGHVLILFGDDPRVGVNVFGDGSLIALPGASGMVTSLTSPVFRALPPTLPYSPTAPGGIVVRSGADDLYGPNVNGTFDSGLGKYLSSVASPLATGLHYFTIFSTDNMSGTVTNSQTNSNGTYGGLSYLMGQPTVTAFVVTAPPTVSTGTLSAGTEGVSYFFYATPFASGGTGNYTFTTSTGAGNQLPDGLSINSASGQISGTPTLAGTFNFTLTATDDSGGSGSAPESITINAGTPAIARSPTSLTFSGTLVGQSSTGQTVTVSNSGYGTLHISSVALNSGAGDYSISSNTCTTLTHSQTPCSFVVTFTPSMGGSRPGNVRILSDASNLPTLDIGLSGTGTLPSFTLTAATAGTGAGTITSAPTGISCPGDCTEPYTSGTMVTLTATASAGSTFTSWAGCDSAAGTNPCTLTVSAARTATATFTANPTTARAEDMNGDGRSDLLYRNFTTGQIYRMFMNGFTIGAQGVAYTEPNTAWNVVADGDFNGDGISDLLWRNDTTGQVYLQPFNSSGLPNGGAVIYTEPSSAWKIVGTPDLNSDGKADVLWWNSTTGQVYGLIMNGTTVTAQGFIYTEPNTAWKIVATGDFSGSGHKNQLLWFNGTTGQVFLQTVTFSGGVFHQSGNIIYTASSTAWRIVGAADLNGDGKTDIIWRNGTTGQVYVLLMNGISIIGQGVIYTEPNQAWKIVAQGDYNGDGNADILWRNDATGQVYMQLMNGLTITNQQIVYTEPNTAWHVMGTWEYGLKSTVLP
jgi:YVTN family beta-propeller protein